MRTSSIILFIIVMDTHVYEMCVSCVYYFSCMNYNGRKQHIKVKVFSYFLSLSSLFIFRYMSRSKSIERERPMRCIIISDDWIKCFFFVRWWRQIGVYGCEVEIEFITNDSFIKIKCSLRDNFLLMFILFLL